MRMAGGLSALRRCRLVLSSTECKAEFIIAEVECISLFDSLMLNSLSLGLDAVRTSQVLNEVIATAIDDGAMLAADVPVTNGEVCQLAPPTDDEFIFVHPVALTIEQKMESRSFVTRAALERSLSWSRWKRWWPAAWCALSLLCATLLLCNRWAFGVVATPGVVPHGLIDEIVH